MHRIARKAAIVVGLAVMAGACQSPPPGPTPRAETPSAPPQVSALPPTRGATPAAVATGASRAEVLRGANDAFNRGSFRVAAELYERVLNTPAQPSEAPDQTAALTGFAGFRATLAWLLAGDEARAAEQVEELTTGPSNGVFARLAAQFWHEYGTTGDVRAACASVAPQVQSQLGTALSALHSAGLLVQPAEVCRVPA